MDLSNNQQYHLRILSENRHKPRGSGPRTSITRKTKTIFVVNLDKLDLNVSSVDIGMICVSKCKKNLKNLSTSLIAANELECKIGFLCKT